MSNPKIIVCLGLQRSGNHAVLDWIASLFPSCAFHNDQPHDLFADAAKLRGLIDSCEADCVIFSFEDSANKAADASRLLVDSVVPFPADLAAVADVSRIAILRDPYNTWASRVAANERAAELGRPLTSDPSWELFRRNWLALAAAEGAKPILFNRWKDDRAYRQEICASLGGTYSERTLDKVSTQGSGSSFEGLPRPSYLGMIARLPKYASRRFLVRLLAKPSYYARRFFAPRLTGRTMKVDERWKILVSRPEAAPLFADETLRRETARVFGPGSLPQI